MSKEITKSKEKSREVEADHKEYGKTVEAMEAILKRFETNDVISRDEYQVLEDALAEVKESYRHELAKNRESIEAQMDEKIKNGLESAVESLEGIAANVMKNKAVASEATPKERAAIMEWVEVARDSMEERSPNPSTYTGAARSVFSDLNNILRIREAQFEGATGTIGIGSGTQPYAPWVALMAGDRFLEVADVVLSMMPKGSFPSIGDLSDPTKDERGTPTPQALDIDPGEGEANLWEKVVQYKRILEDDVIDLRNRVVMKLAQIFGAAAGKDTVAVMKAKTGYGVEVKTEDADSLPSIDKFPAKVAEQANVLASLTGMELPGWYLVHSSSFGTASGAMLDVVSTQRQCVELF